MAILPQMMYRLKILFIKILACFLKHKIDKLIIKFIWKYEGPRRASTILKKNKVEELTTPNLKLLQSYNKSREYNTSVSVNT